MSKYSKIPYRKRKYMSNVNYSKIKSNNKKTYLFIDDERNPKTDKPWKIVRSYDEAIRFFNEHGIPSYISFDHDLGDEQAKTGLDIVKWLIEDDMQHSSLPKNFSYNVHSANPVGRKNIESLFSSYMEFKHNNESS